MADTWQIMLNVQLGFQDAPQAVSFGSVTTSQNNWNTTITTPDTSGYAIDKILAATYKASVNPSASLTTLTSAFKNLPSANGYVFKGWSYNVLTGGTTILASGVTSDTSKIILTAGNVATYHNISLWLDAKWESTSGGGTTIDPTPTPTPTNYGSVSFNGNGGSGVPSSVSPTVNNVSGNYATVFLPSTKPTRSGYTFAGWSLYSSGSGTLYQPNAMFSYDYMTNPYVTLYASWTENTPQTSVYTITYTTNTNNADYVQSYTVPAGGGYINVLSAAPASWKLNGATLTGWVADNLSRYSLGERMYLSRDTMLLAMFAAKPKYTVTFEANGGYSSIIAKDVIEGDAIGTLPTPTYAEFTFDGWFDSPSGGNQYTTTSKIYKDTTLYAHWTAKPLSTPTISVSPSTVKLKGTLNIMWRVTGNYIVYTVEYEYNDSGNWTKQFGNVSSTSGTSTVLDSFTKLRYRVKARNSYTGAESPWGYSNYVTFDKGVVPGRVPSCTVRSHEVDSTTIFTNSTEFTYDVSWTLPTDVDSNLAGFIVEYCTDTNTTWRGTDTIYDPAKLNYHPLCSALTGAKWVKWRVRARDLYGRDTEWRESSQVTVSALSAPEWQGTGYIKYPVPSAPNIFVNQAYKVQWSNATDKDGDLYRYVLERQDNESGTWYNAASLLASKVLNNQPEWTDVIKTTTIKKVRYRVYAEDQTQRRTSTITGPVVNVIHNTPPKAPKYIRAKVEQNAIDEGHPTRMQPLKGGEPNRILWAKAEDAEDNVVGYQLECSLDGEVFRVIKTYTQGTSPTDLFFDYVIPKSATERHDTAQFRVKAKDAFGEESPYVMSRSYNTSNNAAPEVVGEYGHKEYAGVREKAFPIIFAVTDEENDQAEVEVSIYDGNAKLKELFKATVDTPYEGQVVVTDRILSELPMRRLTVRITARDAEGEGVYWFDFTRKGTRASVTLRTPIRYPDPITSCKFTTFEGLFPSDCKIQVEVTNNANDPLGGYWEDCTADVLGKRTYYFRNNIATHGPAFNFRVVCERGPSGQTGYIKRIIGYFETATEKGAVFG